MALTGLRIAFSLLLNEQKDIGTCPPAISTVNLPALVVFRTGLATFHSASGISTPYLYHQFTLYNNLLLNYYVTNTVMLRYNIRP